MVQSERSTFVSVLAWIFIILGGFVTLISLLQNIMIAVMFPVEEMNRTFNDPQFQEQTPFFFRLIFSNIRLFFFSFLIISGTTVVSAIGLLKRKNWARIIFILVMGLGIGWNVLSLVIHTSMFSTMPDIPPEAVNGEFITMMTIMKVFMFILAMGLSYLCLWIIYKLTTPDIKAEFIGISTVNSAVNTEDSRLMPERASAGRRKKAIPACAAILTLVLGIFYFTAGNFKTEEYAPNIHRLVLTGDAERLSVLLKEQPELANTFEEGRLPPLLAAACNGNTECARLLIEAGADVDVRACNRRTALHYGAENGNVEIIALLLNAGADPNLTDDRDKTPLDRALWNNHREAAALLRQHNARTGTELNGTEESERISE